MAWWTGKTAISVCALGDSNFNALGYQPGVQADILTVYHYCSATGQVPYSEANAGWRHISPDSASRVSTEFTSYGALFPDTGFLGQLFGSNGAPATEVGNRLATGTGIPTYIYQVASPGMTSVQFSSGACWDTVARTAQAALDSIPGSPDYFDVVLTNLCGNDLLSSISAEDYYQNMRLMRQNMIDAGWWVPNLTRVMLMEMPRIPSTADFPLAWKGLDFCATRFNDRIGRVSSLGLDINPLDPIPVHFTAESNTEHGRRTGDLLLADIPQQQSTLNIGGVSLSINGSRLKCHGN